jgi:hypothetical protein
MALSPNSLARRKPGVQIPSPPPPTSQVRASSASSGRRSLHVAAALRPQPQVTVQPKGSQRPANPGPGLTHNDHAAWSPPAASPWAIPRASSPSPGRPPRTTIKSKSTHRWPSTACASFERQAPTSGRRRAVMDMAGDHVDPGHPSGASAGPPPHPATSFSSDTADAGTHGRRGPDTGHLNAQTPAPDTGRMDRRPWDTGRSHRTLDTGCRTRTRTPAQPASGPPWPPCRATAR